MKKFKELFSIMLNFLKKKLLLALKKSHISKNIIPSNHLKRFTLLQTLKLKRKKKTFQKIITEIMNTISLAAHLNMTPTL